MRGPDIMIGESRAENIVTWHKINEFTRNQTNSCYYSVCNRISRNVQGNRFLLSSFVKCRCQYSDRPFHLATLHTNLFPPGPNKIFSLPARSGHTMSLSLMFIFRYWDVNWLGIFCPDDHYWLTLVCLPHGGGCAHDGELQQAGHQLPLGRHVHDEGEVDEGHRAQHRAGHAQAQGAAHNLLRAWD